MPNVEIPWVASAFHAAIPINGALVPARRVLYTLAILAVVTPPGVDGWRVRAVVTSQSTPLYLTLHVPHALLERYGTSANAAKHVLRAITSWLRLPPAERPSFLEIQ
jgi:hypothetical protein